MTLSILDQEWNAAIEAAALDCEHQALALRSMNGDGGEWVWPAANSMDEEAKSIRALKRAAPIAGHREE